MSSIELNDEKAIDVLIFYVIGADGHIEYDEEQAAKRLLEALDYDPESYYRETVLHISGLSTEHTNELIDDAIDYICEHFDSERRKYMFALLENLASSDGHISSNEKEKLDNLKDHFKKNNC